MKTNELKKGQRVKLRNGWEAEIADNRKGNRRMAKVFGLYTETGDVYSHDIVQYKCEPFDSDGEVCHDWGDVEHTKPQLKLKEQVDALFNN